jgi:hypothetical protein
MHYSRKPPFTKATECSVMLRKFFTIQWSLYIFYKSVML